MVVTRSGKNTSIYNACVHECGHMCSSSMTHCCACNDIRPMQATYIAHNKSYLLQGSYVSRSHYYCPTCKMAPKPISAPITFQQTLEYKLAEAEKKLAETEKVLAEKNEAIGRIVERLSNPFKSAISRPNF